ncbi:hypothetical protein [Phycisphaera mikurensis]|nr:hypothetical protein [Phycisphaera mikurensis]MBB6442303.1 hypothetical protein [Phycisphaera mikurensis]
MHDGYDFEASGNLRLWKAEGDSAGRSLEHYIQPAEEYSLQDLGLEEAGSTVKLYLEALGNTSSWWFGPNNDSTWQWNNPTSPQAISVHAEHEDLRTQIGDSVLVKPMLVDLRIDSDNDGTLSLRDEALEQAEPGIAPGAWWVINNDDSDSDLWVPDYADGYGLAAAKGTAVNAEADQVSNEDEFYKISTDFTRYAGNDAERLKVRFNYDANDPIAGVQFDGTQGYRIVDGGLIRIWTTDAADPGRDGRKLQDGGSVIESGYAYSVSDLPAAGLYLESVASSGSLADLDVLVEYLLDGVVFASDRVAGTSVASKAGFTTQALQRARINPDTWAPLAGFPFNQNTVQAVYDYYRDTYLANQDDFVWLGMARMAGGAVWDGLITGEQAITLLRAALANPLQTWQDRLGNLYALEIAERQQVMFVEMQKAIFEDLAWQHELYADAGYAAFEILRTHTPKDVPSDVDTVWKQIDAGDVVRGNFALVPREQNYILQPYWDQFTAAFGMQGVVIGQGTRSPLPNGLPFASTPGLGLFPNVAWWPDRERWIELDMWPKWLDYIKRERADLVKAGLGTQLGPAFVSPI